MLNKKISSNASLLKFFIRIQSYARAQKVSFSLAFVGYALYALSQPAFAMLMEIFIRSLQGVYSNGLYIVPFICVGVGLLRGIGSYLGSYYMSKAGANIIHQVRCDMYENIVCLPISFFDENKSGRLVSLFTYNSNLMITSITQSLKTIGREGLTAVSYTHLTLPTKRIV